MEQTDYSEVDAAVTTNWRELLNQAESGDVRGVLESLNGDDDAAASLLRGYAIYTAKPGVAKDLFAAAKNASREPDLRYEAAIFEARCYEYLGQFDEGKILIRNILRHQLSPAVRAHAMLVFAVLQVGTPKRALRTLNSINVDAISIARKARVFYWRAKIEGDLKRYDQALLNYAGAAAYFEETGNDLGVAHSFNNRVSILRRLTRYEEAHESANKALALLPVDDPFTANFLDQKAQVYLAEGRFADAEVLARRAVDLVADTERRGMLCENLCTLARAYAGQSDHARAFAAFRQAESIAELIGSVDIRFALMKARRDAAEEFLQASEVELAELAVTMSNGKVRAAAKKLDLPHSSLRQILKRSQMKWEFKKPQSLIRKSYK